MAESKKKTEKKEEKEEGNSQTQQEIIDNYEKLQNVQIPDEVKKEIEKTREKLKQFQKELMKKFSYVRAIGILPPQATQIIEEEEEIKKESKDERLIHVVILVPDDKLKEINKLQAEAIKLIKDFKPRVWLHIRTMSELWEICFDGKYALAEAIAMSFPLHDDGILSSLRLMSIHKGLVLRKFEKYVVSYVMAGSLITGTTTETSDVDVYVVIDDTDVKRMNRFELREKLRSIIWSYAIEAEDLAGVRNKLNCQIYILTEFWESVKDAHPVIFTMIRDGVPLYDRGAFMPWKLLLKMGKIKPSPEAIDMFMSLGERVAENVRMRLNEILAQDIFWGVVTPSQAVLMLYGLPPPTPKEIQNGEFRKIFVEKEKLLESKYADILERIITCYKKYEHDPKTAISGKEIDEMTKDSTEYMKRLKELMKQIEQKMADREVVELYDSIFDLLNKVIGKCSETTACEKLEKELISRGVIPARTRGLLHDIIEIKKKHKKSGVSKHDVASMKKAVYELTNILTEYQQRKEIFEVEKKKIYLIYKKEEKGRSVEKKAELFIFKDSSFLIPDLTQDTIKKIVNGKISESNKEELMVNLKKAGGEKFISKQLFDILKKIVGEFEIAIG